MIDKLATAITHVDWQGVSSKLQDKGYALVPRFLSTPQCQQFIRQYQSPKHYRKTVNMERHRFGLGEYKYFDYPLPNIVQALRESIYPYLAPIANRWMMQLRIEKQFPSTLVALHAECQRHGQLKPTPLVLKYQQGGFNTLHQDLYGEVYFPLQAVIGLNEPNVDFYGGEFVLTEQVPRAQSRAMVLKPNQGDMIIFTTNFRPVKSSKGYYRASIKHGVSEVTQGTRHALGIIFHDATF